MLTGRARQATQALREAGLVPPAGVDLTDVQRATLEGDLSDLPDLPLDLRNWLLVGALLRKWAHGRHVHCCLCPGPDWCTPAVFAVYDQTWVHVLVQAANYFVLNKCLEDT